MNDAARKRMIGTVSFIVLVIIFVPMLLDEGPDGPETGPIEMSSGPSIELVERQETPPPSTETHLSIGAGGDGQQSLSDDELAPPFGIMAPGDEAPLPARPEPDTAFQPDEPLTSGDDPPPEGPSQVATIEPPNSRPPSPPRSNATPQAPEPTRSPTPTPTVKPGEFVLQIAALSTSARAAGLVEELRQRGFTAFIQRANINGKTYYRVRLGPKANRASAERLADQVARATGHQGQVLLIR